MKNLRLSVFVFAVLFALSCFSITAFAEDGEAEVAPGGVYRQGDVDANKDINIKDATFIQKHLANLLEFSYSQQRRANVDGESALNIKDVTFLQKFLAKLEPQLFEPKAMHQGTPNDEDNIITLPIIPAM